MALTQQTWSRIEIYNNLGVMNLLTNNLQKSIKILSAALVQLGQDRRDSSIKKSLELAITFNIGIWNE